MATILIFGIKWDQVILITSREQQRGTLLINKAYELEWLFKRM